MVAKEIAMNANPKTMKRRSLLRALGAGSAWLALSGCGMNRLFDLPVRAQGSAPPGSPGTRTGGA